MVNRYNGGRPSRVCPQAGGVRACLNNVTPPETRPEMTPPSCSCGSGDCKALLYKLQQVEFALVDVGLYLDIYPENKKAREYFARLCDERETLIKTLATKCHRPMTIYDSHAGEDWDWINSPWPWEISANM